MAQLDQRLETLTANDKSFVVDAPYLLELAHRANDLFASSRSGLKNKLLRAMFSNLKIQQKRVDFTLLEPFNSFFNSSNTLKWLPGLGSNQQPRS